MNAFRAYVVDEVPLVREGLASWLRRCGIDVAGESSDPVAALGAVEAVDLVVLGPDLAGAAETCRLLAVRGPWPRCLTVVPVGGADGVFAALRTGAAYVFADAAFEAFRDAVAGSLGATPRPGARRLAPVPFPPPAEPLAVAPPAGARDAAVLGLLAAGRSNREIADALEMSVGWVKAYVSRLMTRLSARSRTELVALAVREGLLGTEIPEHRVPTGEPGTVVREERA